MSVFGRLQETQVSPKTAGISIGVLLIVCTLVIAAVRNGAVSQPKLGPNVEHRRVPVHAKLVVDKTVASDPKQPKEKVVASSNADDVCRIIADRNIFKPVSATQNADSGRRPPVVPPMPLGRLPVLPGLMGIRLGPGGGSARNLAFTGVVDTPDGRMALIENTSTGETRYAHVGETVFGANLINVGARSVSLNAGGEMVDLALGENKSDSTPGSAAPAAPAGAPGQSPQPAPAPAVAPQDQSQQFPQPFGSGSFQGRRGRRRGNQSNGDTGQ